MSAIDFVAVVKTQPGGGGRCRAMLHNGCCLNAARWDVVTTTGQVVPVCRMHGNKADRTHELEVAAGASQGDRRG